MVAVYLLVLRPTKDMDRRGKSHMILDYFSRKFAIYKTKFS